jgi:hypothetical protein
VTARGSIWLVNPGAPGLGCAREHPAVDLAGLTLASRATPRLVGARCRPAPRTARYRRCRSRTGLKGQRRQCGVPPCTAGRCHGRCTRRTPHPCEPNPKWSTFRASPPYRLPGRSKVEGQGRSGEQEANGDASHASRSNALFERCATEPSGCRADQIVKCAGRSGEVARRRDRHSDLIPIRDASKRAATRRGATSVSAGQRPFRGPGRS